MMFMNTWEIDEAVQRWAHHPVLSRATQTLANVRDMADDTSDGWAYWPKPARAAAKLQRLIESGNTEHRFGRRATATEADLRAAYAPIKAFCTRNNRKVDLA